jgi:hypothetical protein
MQENLKHLEAELVVVLSGLNARDAQLTPHANPGKWNIQQIVEHLLLSYRSTVTVIKVRLEKGKPTQARPSLQQRIGQFGLIEMGYFPRGRKAPAQVCPTLPASLRNGEELTRRVHEELAVMAEVLAQGEGLFGSRRFASHAVLGPLSARQWRGFHLVHGRHHIKQIRTIRQNHEA